MRTVAEKLAVRLGDYMEREIAAKPELEKFIQSPDPNCPRCYGRGHTGLMGIVYVRCKCTRKK